MAKKKMTELTSITGAQVAAGDKLVLVDVSDTTMSTAGTNKSIEISELGDIAELQGRFAATLEGLRYQAPEASPAGRTAILKDGVGGVGGVRIESSAWYYGGAWHVIFTAGSGYLYYATCADTDPTGTWTITTTPVIGNNNGGHANNAVRSCVIVDGTTLRCWFVDTSVSGDGDVYYATAPIATPTVWTTAGKVFDRSSASPTISTTGNIFVVEDGATWRMFYEGLYYDGTYSSWQTGIATSSTPGGTFTTAVFPLTTLRTGLETVKGTVSGIWIGWDDVNEVWVAWYHSCEWAQSLPDFIYRATTEDLSTDSWTIDNGGYPIVTWAHEVEVDQVADPYVAQGPDGRWWGFWEGYNNVTGDASLLCAPLSAQRVAAAGAPMIAPYAPDYFEWTPIYHNNASPNVGGWTAEGISALIGGGRWYNTAATLNDFFEIPVLLRPGTWKLTATVRKGSSNGIATFSVDNGGGGYFVTALGTIDGYNATDLNNQKSEITFTIKGRATIRRKLKVQVTSKNASSSSYYFMLQGISLERTGD